MDVQLLLAVICVGCVFLGESEAYRYSGLIPQPGPHPGWNPFRPAPFLGGGWYSLSSDDWKTLPDGTKVCGCFDPKDGHHEHNETWISSLRWKMRCENGTISMEACIGSRGGNYVEVPINETKEVDKFWHKCEENDKSVKYTQEASCVINGKELHVNDTFRQNNFKIQCEEWGYSIAGCYYDYEGDEKELDIGATEDHGIMRHFCEPVPGFKGRIRYRTQAVACKQGGEMHKEGETWVGKHLKYLCKDHGEVKIINCVTKNGTEIAIGQAVVIDNTLHRCYRVGPTVYYQANACGFNSPACNAGTIQGPQINPFIRSRLFYPQRPGVERPLVVSSSFSGNQERVFYKPRAFP